jgi:TonB family protein
LSHRFVIFFASRPKVKSCQRSTAPYTKLARHFITPALMKQYIIYDTQVISSGISKHCAPTASSANLPAFLEVPKIMKSILLTLATASFVTLISVINIQAQSDPNHSSADAKLLSAPAPKYPDEAKKTGLGGKVSVLVALDENGNVTGVERVSGPDWVCEAVAYPDVVALREAAKSAALRAKFTPAMRDGKPTTSTILVNYDFKGKAQASGGPRSRWYETN